MSVLLLCDDDRSQAATTLDHIDALRRLSRHRVRTLNPVGLSRSALLDLSEFDAVVVHYSVVVVLDTYLAEPLRDQIRAYTGLKAAFLQDEYRWVDAIAAALRDLGVSVLFSVAPPAAVEGLYGSRLPGVDIAPTLTGWVPDRLLHYPTAPPVARPLDVVYRGRELPPWLGRIGREKAAIGRCFLEHARGTTLACDIGWRETDRIYGDAWNAFLASGRATLGTPSGASVADFDGSLQLRVEEYLGDNPGADFEQLHAAVLAPFEGNVVIDVVSPRIFEAAALRTALVLFPGEYSGVVRAGEHYIPLERDFSNFDSVVEQLRDFVGLRALTERTHADVVASRRYSEHRFAEEFDRVLDVRADRRARGVAIAYPLARAERAVRVPASTVRARLGATRAWRSARAAVKGGLAVGLVLGDPPLRHLLAAYVRHRRRAPTVRSRALLNDLLKLGLARRAQAGELAAGPAFELEPSFDEGRRRLTLHSRAGRTDGGAHGGRRASAAEIREIVWRHVDVGETVPWRIARLKTIAIELGARPAGIHRFEALEALVRAFPEEAYEALEPLLRRSSP